MAAAAELFAADGYTRTTLAKIASAAGVSAETVQGQGPKAALLIAAIEYTAFGVVGEENILNLEIGRKLAAIEDFESAVDYLVETQTEVHRRTAQLALALTGGADADPELDRYRNELIAGVDRQALRVLDLFRDRGWVCDDVPFDELAATCAALCSIDVYLRTTRSSGWSVPAYQRWLRRMLMQTVFAAPQAD